EGGLVVVEVDEVVAPTAVSRVASSATHQPVVAVVAEDDVGAVVVHRAVGVDLLASSLRYRAAVPEHAFGLVEIEQELERHAAHLRLPKRAGGRELDLAQRVVLVIERELAR